MGSQNRNYVLFKTVMRYKIIFTCWDKGKSYFFFLFSQLVSFSFVFCVVCIDFYPSHKIIWKKYENLECFSWKKNVVLMDLWSDLADFLFIFFWSSRFLLVLLFWWFDIFYLILILLSKYQPSTHKWYKW